MVMMVVMVLLKLLLLLLVLLLLPLTMSLELELMSLQLYITSHPTNPRQRTRTSGIISVAAAPTAHTTICRDNTA